MEKQSDDSVEIRELIKADRIDEAFELLIKVAEERQDDRRLKKIAVLHAGYLRYKEARLLNAESFDNLNVQHAKITHALVELSTFSKEQKIEPIPAWVPFINRKLVAKVMRWGSLVLGSLSVVSGIFLLSFRLDILTELIHGNTRVEWLELLLPFVLLIFGTFLIFKR